jgi:predicted metal-dependent hydrolase
MDRSNLVPSKSCAPRPSADIIQRVTQIPVAQIIRSKRKTLALLVKPDGSVLVRAPLRTSNALIQEFVEKNTGWIEKHRAKALAALRASSRRYLTGDMVLYLGTSYPLEILEGHAAREPLRLEDGKFKLAASQQGEAALAFERWYREQAKQIVTARVELLARQYGFSYRKIGITAARTRWGSCSATGSLSFSWRLIRAPLAVVDYVVVHELVHTLVHNHSKRFWSRVGTIMPDFPSHRRWLRENGRGLLI